MTDSRLCLVWNQKGPRTQRLGRRLRWVLKAYGHRAQGGRAMRQKRRRNTRWSAAGPRLSFDTRVCEHAVGRNKTTYYNRLTWLYTGSPCFTLFLCDTTLWATEHDYPAKQSHTEIRLFNVLCPPSCSWNIYSITRGHRVILSLSLHSWLCYPFVMSFPPHCLLSFLRFFDPERLSCDLLNIFSIRTAFIILCCCFFSSIIIYLLYIWIEIYMYILLQTNIYHIFSVFFCESPDVTLSSLQNILSNSFSFFFFLLFLELSLLGLSIWEKKEMEETCINQNPLHWGGRGVL